MKKKTENSTVNYDPVQVNEMLSINFTKVTGSKGVTIYGKVMKDGAEVGSVSYDAAGDYLITNLKPFSKVDAEEVVGIYAQIPECIQELLEE